MLDKSVRLSIVLSLLFAVTAALLVQYKHKHPGFDANGNQMERANGTTPSSFYELPRHVDGNRPVNIRILGEYPVGPG